MTPRTHLAGTRCAGRLKAPRLAEVPTCPRCWRAYDFEKWSIESKQQRAAADILRRAFPDADLPTVARCLVALAEAHPDELDGERVLLAVSGRKS